MGIFLVWMLIIVHQHHHHHLHTTHSLSNSTTSSSFSSLLQAAMAAAAALLPFPTTLSSAKWQPSMFSKDHCITFLSSCALRRTSFLPKDSLLLLRCRAPCFMSVDVDSEPVDDTQSVPPLMLHLLLVLHLQCLLRVRFCPRACIKLHLSGTFLLLEPMRNKGLDQ